LETPSEEITKINLLNGKYRLLVAGGYNGASVTPTVEILDLENSNLVCTELPPFQVGAGLESLRGGLTFLEQPLKCGGRYSAPSSSCKIYDKGAWKESSQLINSNTGFEMTASPFRNKSISFLITGGNNDTNDFNYVQVGDSYYIRLMMMMII
jgi:hypothetical protein